MGASNGSSKQADLVPPLPRELQIEVTGACNLRCRMCLVSYRPPLNKMEGSLSFDTFRQIVDDLPELESITMQGLGEPLLAPHLFDMIEYASARGIAVGFNTNATLLTRAKAERLVKAGLDWLHISLDGATAATYESIRDGSSFERVESNVKGLIEVMRALGSDKPEIELVFVAMRGNIAELSALVRLAAAWGVPKLWVQNLSHSFSDTDPAGDYHGIRSFTATEALWSDCAVGDGEPSAQEIFDAARSLAGTLRVELRLPEVDEQPAGRAAGTPGCDWPWRSAYLNHTGEVQPCCMVMGADRAVLGDLRADTFPEVWSSQAYQDFRGALLTDEPPAVCQGCSLYRGVF